MNTTIEYDSSLGIDIEKLSKMSEDVDKTASKAIKLRDMSVKQQHVTNVMMVKPVTLSSSASGPHSMANMYVSTKSNNKVVIDWNNTIDLLVKDLTCDVQFINTNGIVRMHMNADKLAIHMPYVCMQCTDIKETPVHLAIVDAMSFNVDVTSKTYDELSKLKTIC